MGKGWKAPHKAAAAAKKGQIFTKLAREIAVSAKLGGGVPDANPRLKMAINAARSASCPKDTIERAIRKGTGQLDDGAQIEELTYEGMAPHNVGVIVECQTDNKNRTVSEVRAIFNKRGGNFGEAGSVMWMFDRVALIEAKKADVGDPEEEAIEAGADDVEKNTDGTYSFYGATSDLDQVRNTLTERGWEVTSAELSYKAKNATDISDEQKKEVFEFLEILEDNEDTHRIHATIG